LGAPPIGRWTLCAGISYHHAAIAVRHWLGRGRPESACRDCL